MPKSQAAGKKRQVLALFLSAALIVSGFGPGCSALAEDFPFAAAGAVEPQPVAVAAVLPTGPKIPPASAEHPALLSRAKKLLAKKKKRKLKQGPAGDLRLLGARLTPASYARPLAQTFDGRPEQDLAAVSVGGARAPPPASARLEADVRAKLDEQYDADSAHPGHDSSHLRSLSRLRGQFAFPGSENPRRGDPAALLENRGSDLSLTQRVRDYFGARDGLQSQRQAAWEKLEPLVKELGTRREQLQTDLRVREEARAALAAAETALARSKAVLDEDMDRIHRADANVLATKDDEFAVGIINNADLVRDRMLAFLESRRQAILQSQASNAQGQQSAAAGLATLPQIQQMNAAALLGDQMLTQTVQNGEAESRLAAQAVPLFQSQVSGLINFINTTDKKNSADAAAEYQRRLDLLPQIYKSRLSGNDPSSPISASQIKSDQDQITQNLQAAQQGLIQMHQLVPSPWEGGILIVYAPPPALDNPGSPADTINKLEGRRKHYQDLEQGIVDAQKTINAIMDPNNSAPGKTDEFGDTNPQSLFYWEQKIAQPAADQAKAQAAALLAQLDASARTINAGGANLPMLSPLLSGPLTNLQTALEAYPNQLQAAAAALPSGAFTAFPSKIALIDASRLLPLSSAQVVVLSYNQGVIDAVESAKPTLNTIQDQVKKLLAVFDAVFADIDADEAAVRSVPPGAKMGRDQQAAVFQRKDDLLRNKIIPPLQEAQNVLVPALGRVLAQDAASAAPGGVFERLYRGKLTLINGVTDLYNKQMTWALASFGGPLGNVAASKQSLDAWRQSLRDNLKLVDQNLKMVQDRSAVGISSTEFVGGEIQPYSLPDKIKKYGAELGQNAVRLNTLNPQVNAILSQIQSLTGGSANFSGLFLPVNITSGADGAVKVQSMSALVPNLIAKLQALAQAGGAVTTVSVGNVGGGRVPTGVQPSPTVSPAVQAQLEALEALKRLLPSGGDGPAAITTAVARYLYDQQVIAAAVNAQPLVAQALNLLPPLKEALRSALEDTKRDEAYLSGGSETPASLYGRKASIFQRIHDALVPLLPLLNAKQIMDQGSTSTTGQLQTYFNALSQIYSGGQSVNAGELRALDQMESAVRSVFAGLDQTRDKLKAWLSQLNPREQSAFNQMAAAHAQLLEHLIAIAQDQKPRRALQKQIEAWDQLIQAEASGLRVKQAELEKLRGDPAVREVLSPAQLHALDALASRGGMTALAGERGELSALVVDKARFPDFLDMLWEQLHGGLAGLNSAQWPSLKQGLIRDPGGLSSVFPGLGALSWGGSGPDDFRLVYKSYLSAPHGLETGSRATLDNLLHWKDTTVSLSAYHFISPPSADGSNPGVGGGGVELRVGHAGDNSYQYLVANLWRSGTSIPLNNGVLPTFDSNRLYILAGHAAVLGEDNKLTFGSVGYADFALSHPDQNVSLYGGNMKMSYQLDKTISLTAEQRRLFVKDPRSFLETVNLASFSGGWAQEFNQNFLITNQGTDSWYSRSQAGLSFNFSRSANPFTLDLYYSSTRGNEDISQNAGGVSLLKGFSLKDKNGHDWLQIRNQLSAEKGPQAAIYRDVLAVVFPGSGISLDAQGQIIGAKSSYYAQIARVLNPNSRVSVGYGAQTFGANNRLFVGLDTSLSLRQVWDKVAGAAAQDFSGGAALAGFDAELAKTLDPKAKGAAESLRDLALGVQQDLGRRLREQELGALCRGIAQLRQAGAFLDNTRARARAGYSSRAPSNSTSELAAAGGPTIGLYTDAVLKRSQKKLIEAQVQSLYRSGLQLQDRLAELIRDWEAALAGLARAQYELALAQQDARTAPDGLLRAEANLRLVQARAAEHQAALSYNAALGREALSAVPQIDQKDLKEVLNSVSALLSGPLSKVLSRLEDKKLAAVCGSASFNVLDWLPWVEELTAGVGVQLPDILAGQAFTAGASITLPIYEPAARGAEKAYVLESRATIEDMAAIAQRRRLERAQEAEFARLAAAAPGSAFDLENARSARERARRAYLNGDGSLEQLHRAEENWRKAEMAAWDAGVRAELSAARLAAASAFDGAAKSAPPLESGPGEIRSLRGAVAAAEGSSHGLKAAALRAQALEAAVSGHSRRLRAARATIGASLGVTTFGLGWAPSLPITGVAITPVLGLDFSSEELRRLQLRDDSGRREESDALQAVIRAGLAVQIYQASVAAQKAEKPEERARARAVLNSLLGRSPEAPLDVRLDPQSGLEELKSYLQEHSLVAAQKRVLDSRVAAAKAQQEIIDKNLRVQQLKTDPVSLILRGLGRLIGVLADAPAYDPQAAADALLRARAAEHERDSYDARRKTQAAELRAQLAEARRLHQEARAFSLEAGLAALEESAAAASGAMPKDWEEAQRRLEEASREQALAAPIGAHGDASAAPREGLLTGGARVYRALVTLGDEPIDKTFLEGWVELRMNQPGLGPEGALELARLRVEREARLADARREAGTARARALASQFESDVRLWRWAGCPGGRPGYRGFCQELASRLQEERGLMAAWLDLPADAPLDQLDALAGMEPASAPRDPQAMAARLIAEIRASRLESLSRTLFEEGLPSGVTEDEILRLLRADIIAASMGFRGYTPVLAFGIFRGQSIGGGFLEAPDPREMEHGLTNLISKTLRAQLEAEGGLRLLSQRLRARMIRVQDGVHELEARRRLVEAAEFELRAAAALAGPDAPLPSDANAARHLAQSQERLINSWTGLGQQAAALKADFVALVSELEALRPDPSALAAAAATAGAPDARVSPEESREALVDFWLERAGDPGFQPEQDQLLAQLGDKVKPEDFAALAAYRQALRQAESARAQWSKPSQRTALLARLQQIDAGGKRLAVRARLARVFQDAGGLEESGPLLRTLRAEAERVAASAGAPSAKAVVVDLRGRTWRAARPGPAQAAAFQRLDRLSARLDAAHRALDAAYLARGRDADRFLVVDPRLDAALRAEEDFDRALIQELRSGAFAGDRRMAKILDQVYDLRGAIERERVRAWRGRGLAALNLLVRLARSRLAQSRARALAPEQIAADARSLQDLRETRERWLAGASRGGPAYAVVRVENGARTWRVLRWSAGKPESGADEEAVGGADAAWARQIAARRALKENQRRASVEALLRDHDLAADDGSASWSIEQVFGSGGLFEQGRVLFFSPDGKGPLEISEALATPPDRLMIKIKDGPSLKIALLSSQGAGRLAEYLQRRRDAEQSLGWIAVKLYSYGFARADSSAPLKLYATRAEFEAERRALRDAPRSLARAEQALDRAQREEQAWRVKAESARAKLEASRSNPHALPAAGKADKFAAEKWRLAQARRINAESALQRARETLEHSRAWTLHRSDGLELGLSADGRVVSAGGAPIGGGGVAAETIRGSLAAAAVDAQGRVRRRWTTQREAEKAALSWSLKAFDADGEHEALNRDGTLRLKSRLQGYEATVDGEKVPVLIGGGFLSRRVEQARGALGAVKRWGLSHIPQLLMEIPKGLTQIPAEIFAGYDPARQGTLGRLALNKEEGGESAHRGLLGSETQPFFDPSQFPERVNLGSPLKPGESLARKAARDPVNGRDVLFGRRAIARELRESNEDLAAARARAQAHFSGAMVEERLAAAIPGRAGEYTESIARVRAPRLGDQEGESSVRPGSLFLLRARRWLHYQLGTEGYGRWLGALGGYAERAAERARDLLRAHAVLQQEERSAGGELARSLKARKLAESRANSDR